MVKVTAEQIPDSQVRLNIEVEPERIEKSVEKAYRRLANQVNIPGFRRGKAPRPVVERFVGRETLFQEGLEQLLNEVYREAVEELDLHPIDKPEVDLEPKAANLKPGEALVITATVPVRPTVHVGDYRAIRVPRVEVQVTEHEVNQIIDRIQEQETEWVPVDHQVEEGNRVAMDVLGQVGTYARLYSAEGEPLLQSSGGQTIVDEKRTEFEVEKQSPRYPAGFVDQLIGMVPGQEKQFELSLPPDYPDPDLANKLAMYKVKVDEVKEKRIPPIDDDLAKAVGYESLEQMRQELRQRAQLESEARAREVYEETVIQDALNRSTVEVPPTMVNHEIDHLLEHARDNLRQQRLDLADYLRLTRKSESELREEFREPATRNVRTALLLQRISEEENVQVSPEEVDREIELMSLIAGPQADRIRQMLSTPEQREALGRRIRQRKTVQLLVDIAQSGEEGAAEAAEGVQAEAPAAGGEAAEAPAESTGEPEAVASGEAPTEPAGTEAASEGESGPVEAGSGAGELDKE